MITLAKFLLECPKEHNGHKHSEMAVTFQDAKQLIKDLEEECPASSFVLELWTDGANIYQKDYWSTGEHPMNHKDRLIAGVEILDIDND